VVSEMGTNMQKELNCQSKLPFSLISKKIIIISALFWIGALILFAAFHLWGETLIDNIYHEHSYSFLNQLIENRDVQPLVVYHQKANYLVVNIVKLLLLLSVIPYFWAIAIPLRRLIAASEKDLTNLMAFGTFLLLAIFVRMPFFFQSVIDWDESTFILMGQSILDGNLPYVELWDNKPPLAFVPFAVFIWLFGDSIVGVRIAGAICLSVAAFLTHLIAGHLWGRLAGFLSGAMTIVFVSLAPLGQATMSEILALVPLMGALAITVRYGMAPKKLFFVGFLISIAALVRLNLAYLAVVMGLFILFKQLLSEKRLPVGKLALYVVGGLVPIALVCLPYVLGGHLETLITSAVVAPLQYSVSQNSAADSFIFHIKTGFGVGNALLWVGFLAGIGMCTVNWTNYSNSQKQGIFLIAAFFLGTALSIINTGSAFYHHLIQIVSLLSLPAGLFYASLFSHRYKKGIVIVFAILMTISFLPVLRAYKTFAWNLLYNRPLMLDEGYRLAAYLKDANSEGKPVYLMDRHIAYWLTGTKPIIKIVTHPDNIGRPYLIKVLEGPDASTETEMKKIITQMPMFIVKKERHMYLKHDKNAQRILDNALRNDYVLAETIGKLYVYKRKPDATKKTMNN
jgi:hypothetical protein